jgi:hypothetical protein
MPQLWQKITHKQDSCGSLHFTHKPNSSLIFYGEPYSGVANQGWNQTAPHPHKPVALGEMKKKFSCSSSSSFFWWSLKNLSSPLK